MTNNDRPNTIFAQTLSEQDSTQREAPVVGDGPRIQPLEVEELTDDLMMMVTRIAQVNSAIDSRDQAAMTDLMADHVAATPAASISTQLANLPEIIRTMLRHPDLFACQTDIGIQLLGRGALSGRDRELAILRIGWLCQAPYEWGEHVLIAKKLGITSEEIERITHGSTAPGWSDHDQAILRAVEELRESAMISDATWATLAQCLDERQLIELPIVIGQYQAVAYYQNSLRLRLHEGNLGLQAR